VRLKARLYLAILKRFWTENDERKAMGNASLTHPTLAIYRLRPVIQTTEGFLIFKVFGTSCNKYAAPPSGASLLLGGGQARYSPISLNAKFGSIPSGDDRLTKMEKKPIEKSKFILDALHLFHELRAFTYIKCLVASWINFDGVGFWREYARYPW